MQDFTEGNIGKQVIRFSTMLMVGNLLFSLYGVINMVWVGRLLGYKAVAAVSASLPIINFLPAFLMGLGMATNILIAQAFGRKDKPLLEKIMANSFFTSFLCCLIVCSVGLLLRRQLLEWVHAPEEIQDMAQSYLAIMMVAFVFQFLVNWTTATLRGLGDVKAVVRILFLLTFLNFVFVPLFIQGIGPLPPLGVTGAAWGTALAAAVTAIIVHSLLVRRNPYVSMRNWDYTMDLRIIKDVFVIGVPASLQMIVISLASVLILSLVNRYGTDVTAAFGICMQIDVLALIPIMSIGMSATSIAGQNLGAQKVDRVVQTLHSSVYFGLAITLVCTALLAIFPQQIGTIFLKESAERSHVLNLVGEYYRWMAFIFPFFAITYAIQGVLRSSGVTMSLLVLSFIALIVVRVPLAYLLAVPLSFNQEGIWMAMLFSGVFSAGLNWLYSACGQWKKKKIL